MSITMLREHSLEEPLIPLSYVRRKLHNVPNASVAAALSALCPEWDWQREYDDSLAFAIAHNAHGVLDKIGDFDAWAEPMLEVLRAAKRHRREQRERNSALLHHGLTTLRGQCDPQLADIIRIAVRSLWHKGRSATRLTLQDAIRLVRRRNSSRRGRRERRRGQ